MRNINGKKALILTMAAVAVMSLAACTKKEEATETEAATEAAAETGNANDANAAAIEAVKPVRPENLGTVELGEYKGITIKTAKAATVTDEELKSYIDTNLLPNATGTSVDTVEDGVTTYISFVGTVDGEQKPECCSEGTNLKIGSGQYIAGFESGLVGHKKGETVTLNLTFPEDYYSDLAGKDVQFDVTLIDITKPQTELTDEVANELSGGQYTTAKEFKEQLRQIMQDSYDLQADQQLLYDAASAALENSTVKPTNEAVDWQIDNFIVSYDKTLQSNYGMTLANLLANNGQTYEDFRRSLYDYCRDSVSRTMVLEEIAKKENIVVDEKMMNEYVEGYGATLEEVLKVTDEAELTKAIIEDKASQIIVDNGKIEYTENEQ